EIRFPHRSTNPSHRALPTEKPVTINVARNHLSNSLLVLACPQLLPEISHPCDAIIARFDRSEIHALTNSNHNGHRTVLPSYVHAGAHSPITRIRHLRRNDADHRRGLPPCAAFPQR